MITKIETKNNFPSFQYKMENKLEQLERRYGLKHKVHFINSSIMEFVYFPIIDTEEKYPLFTVNMGQILNCTHQVGSPDPLDSGCLLKDMEELFISLGYRKEKREL